MKTEIAPGLGIAMYGELNEKDELDVEYYFPYISNDTVTSKAECSIQRHAEKKHMQVCWMNIKWEFH